MYSLIQKLVDKKRNVNKYTTVVGRRLSYKSKRIRAQTMRPRCSNIRVYETLMDVIPYW